MHPVIATQAKLRQKALVIGLLGVLPLTAIGPPWIPAFAGAASANATATTWVVENCHDAGAGSLRDAVEVHAISGDTVDLSQLTCSTITLTSGAIHVSQDDLTLVGPGASSLDIYNSYSYQHPSINRNFAHTGYGTLVVRDLTLENGFITANYGRLGGCIYSRGSVVLDHTQVQYCEVHSTDDPSEPVMGGAIYTAANLTLDHSIIELNRAEGDHGAMGGAAYVHGNLTMSDSRIQYNLAQTDYGVARGAGAMVGGSTTMTRSTIAYNWAKDENGHAFYTAGGGIWSSGPFVISQSTINGNHAQLAGALMSIDSVPGDERTIVDSTVTGNFTDLAPAGIYMLLALTLSNSTVAFNYAAAPASDGDAGIRSELGISMQSSIISNNAAAGVPADLHGDVTGANNLIFHPGTASVPADTLVGVDPLLGPLAYNGGATENHFLLTGSPAIDAGNNAAGEGSDQRGFPRVAGAATDIGAVEVQPPAALVDPAELDFMAIDVGDVSAPLTTTLSNPGDTALHVDSIQAAALPFAQTGGSCAAAPFNLAAHASCTLEFTFAPIEFGPVSTSLDIATDAGHAQITLRGEGLGGSLAVTPDSIDFGDIAVGASAPPQTVRLRNVGTNPLVVNAIDAPDAPFWAIGGSCGAVPFELDADASCSLAFEFAPLTAGPAMQTLTVASDVGNDDFTLLGEGVQGSLAVTPDTIDFGDVAVGDSAPPQTVTVRNTGTNPLVVSAIDAPSAPFTAAGGTCGAPPFELDADASCSLEVGFAPQVSGTVTQTLAVTSDVGNDDFTLVGNGSIDDRIFAAGFE
ncbi:MAG TPA: choice-of-anchor D domain-containing protein [Rhodanobacteraceae bacterium]|nr:choice-of-anchor D domain-containing protein [Rhodanobacteraceae bacterium]